MSIVEGFFTLDLATAATTNGSPLDLRGIAGLSIQTEFGEITGTLTLESRNHESLSWVEVDDVTLTNPAGSAGGQLIDIGNARSRYYRVTYTHTSGTGALRVCIHAKGD
jgi:hypothetical protein